MFKALLMKDEPLVKIEPKVYASPVNPNKKLKYTTPADRTIIFVLDQGPHQQHCPSCDTLLISIDRNKRRCMSCHRYLAFPDDNLETMVEARMQAGVYTVDIDLVKYPDVNRLPIHFFFPEVNYVSSPITNTYLKAKDAI